MNVISVTQTQKIGDGHMSVTQRYSKVAILLHWLIALAIFGMFALGWYMSELPKDGPKQMAFDLFDLGIYQWSLAEEASQRTFYFNLHTRDAHNLQSLGA